MCSIRAHGMSVPAWPSRSRMNAPNEPKRSRGNGNRIVSCIRLSMCRPLTSRINTSSTCHLEAQPCADTVPA